MVNNNRHTFEQNYNTPKYNRNGSFALRSASSRQRNLAADMRSAKAYSSEITRYLKRQKAVQPTDCNR